MCVFEQERDRLRRVLLVGSDHAARPALDPARGVQARLDAAALVGNRPRALVEGDAGQPDAPVADAAEDDPAGDGLPFARPHSAAIDELVADELDRLDLAVAQ